MTHIEILVEEQSILPVIDSVIWAFLGQDDTYAVRDFRGKYDLLKQLPKRLQGYEWRRSEGDFKVLILIDRDDNNCVDVKAEVAALVDASRMARKGSSTRWNVLIRVVCEELEAWYFGDWQAVTSAFPRVSPSIPSKAKYRHSDDIAGGTYEAFAAILAGSGYVNESQSKTRIASLVGPSMDPEVNVSPSFNAFAAGVRELVKVGV